MQKVILLGVVLVFSFSLGGCTVKTYSLTKDRVDQELAGNRGYLLGSLPAGEVKERSTTRPTQVFEVEFFSPAKSGKKAKKQESELSAQASDSELWGNQGYVAGQPEVMVGSTQQTFSAPSGSFETYTVQKKDTLQKISKKFFGTTKKWTKIYEANKDRLKNPDSIYPGQEINIPIEGGLKEPQENLK